jgi:hypothetical protein
MTRPSSSFREESGSPQLDRSSDSGFPTQDSIVLDVVMHEVADTAMATSTALAVVIDGRLLPVLIVDRTPKQFGAQLHQTALTINAGTQPHAARLYHSRIYTRKENQMGIHGCLFFPSGLARGVLPIHERGSIGTSCLVSAAVP